MMMMMMMLISNLFVPRLTSMNFYEVYSDHHVPTTVNSFDEIGSAFNFSVKVSKHFLYILHIYIIFYFTFLAEEV